MKQQMPADEIVCIIYDELMYFAESAANQLKLRSIILRTNSAATQISRIALLQRKEDGSIPLQGMHMPTRPPLTYRTNKSAVHLISD